MFSKDEKQLGLFPNEFTEETMEAALEAAFRAGKIPIECCEKHELPNGMIVKTVEFHEV